MENLKQISITMFSFLLMLLNLGGTIAWINLYTSGRFTEWWVFVVIIVCILGTLIYANELYKNIVIWKKIQV